MNLVAPPDLARGVVIGVKRDAGTSFVGVANDTAASVVFLVGRVDVDQVTNESVRSRLKASDSCRAHGHSRWRCKVAVRPLIVIRPAVCNKV